MILEKLYCLLNVQFVKDGNYERMSSMAVEREVGEFLYYFVKLVKPGIIVETGSGFSTFLMANALEENQKGHIYSFNIKDQKKRNEMLQNADLLKCATLIEESANKIKNVSRIDMLFLDAVHTYEAVMEEVEIFKPFLKKGSYLLFHDSTHPKFVDKVGKAIKELQTKMKVESMTFETVNGLSILKKIED